MLKASHVIALFVLMGLARAQFAGAQELPVETDLKLVIIGNGEIKKGVVRAFRIYEAPDNTRGQVWSVKFDSQQAAQQQVEDWVKATRRVTSREENQIKGRIMINDRISGTNNLPKSDKQEFVIIRRDGQICYLIESESLRVATKIEDLIRHD